jgi:type II secretory ATPase GspE/PulE/Tfp pilus assembly ATPase PilB-like protein
MPTILGSSEIFRGRDGELHLSTSGVAHVRYGKKPEANVSQGAAWDEVAGAQVGSGGKAVAVTFADAREPWYVNGLKPEEAAWAQALVAQGIARAQLYADPRLSGPLAIDAIAEAVKAFAELEPPEAAALADLLVVQAAHNRATDVHLQPEAEGLAIAYRIDGHLWPVAAMGAEIGARVVARLKVMAGMKSYRRNLAQTGATSFPVGDRRIDARCTCLPTVHGEKLTLRLFDPAQALVDVGALGMEKAVLAAFVDLLSRPRGCVLLTGPAGSGKTTTMYAALSTIRAATPDRSIATVEEPVELELAGVAQTEVNRDVGLDFADGLRTALRQDPQVLMVGEIRDAETANTAVQAGLTGHLVFSTVHAPSAAGVFTRLTQLGVEPYLVASSVTAVMAQRLVRRVCSECFVSHTPTVEELAWLGISPGDLAGGTPQRGRGCEVCGGTGYIGRVGLFALLPVTERMREALISLQPLSKLEEIAAEEGVGDLWQAGLAKVSQGLTTVDELRTVLGPRM